MKDNGRSADALLKARGITAIMVFPLTCFLVLSNSEVSIGQHMLGIIASLFYLVFGYHIETTDNFDKSIFPLSLTNSKFPVLTIISVLWILFYSCAGDNESARGWLAGMFVLIMVACFYCAYEAAKKHS